MHPPVIFSKGKRAGKKKAYSNFNTKGLKRWLADTEETPKEVSDNLDLFIEKQMNKKKKKTNELTTALDEIIKDEELTNAIHKYLKAEDSLDLGVRKKNKSKKKLKIKFAPLSKVIQLNKWCQKLSKKIAWWPHFW